MATEVELKITLDPGMDTRLRRDPALEAREVPGRDAQLVSVYYDTPGESLARAGIALRLRREGRRWIQTIKMKPPKQAGATAGLFANHEVECPAPGARLVLEGEDPAYAAVRAAAGEAPLAALFETRVRRRIERLRLPEGTVELAIDKGQIVAGSHSEPILEAELELKQGEVAALYTLARRLFRNGPIRFATLNKSARGYALARGETAAPKPAAPGFSAETGVEAAAGAVLRDCFAQIAREQERLADTTAPEAAHQLRVGLRRLRTALRLFEPALGAGAAAQALADRAGELGREVSALRDLDVLEEEVTALAESGLDAEARAALIAALDARREVERAGARAAFAAPEGVGFLLDLGQFIETRGWLAPSDYGQTARLAQPVGEAAGGLLDARLRAARRRAKHLDRLSEAQLHDLRKALKKLRYGVEMLAPVYEGREVALYTRAIKDLQDRFGSLTDAAMARHWLTGEAALGRADPAAQRAAGWLLGTMSARVAADRPRIFAAWEELAGRKPFWRR